MKKFSCKSFLTSHNPLFWLPTLVTNNTNTEYSKPVFVTVIWEPRVGNKKHRTTSRDWKMHKKRTQTKTPYYPELQPHPQALYAFNFTKKFWVSYLFFSSILHTWLEPWQPYILLYSTEFNYFVSKFTFRIQRQQLMIEKSQLSVKVPI